MPSAGDLPPSLAEFARCQAVELSETRWRYDAERLIATLQARFAIESDAAPLTGGDGDGAGWPTRLANDLVDLAVHPQRLIARRQTGHASDHARAFAFLAAAIAVGNLTLLVGLDVRVARAESFAIQAVGFASWLLVGELVGLIAGGLMAATLGLAWRVASGESVYRRVGLVTAYVYAGAWLGFCAGALMLGSAFQFIDPAFVHRLVDAVQSSPANATTSVPAATPWPEPRAIRLAPFGGAGAVLIVIAFALWIATAAWCVAAWGAYRRAFATSRSRAWLATALWLALIGALFFVGYRLG